MSDLQDLYQEVILDHNKNPRNHGSLENPDAEAKGHNPLCGDELTLELKLDGDRVTDVKFVGKGCAISTASASVMTQIVRGKTLAEIERLFGAFHDLVTGKGTEDDVGKLAVFAGVGEFPARVKCATLSWHTLQAALDGKQNPASTE